LLLIGIRLETEAEELRLLNEKLKLEEEAKKLNYELMIEKALGCTRNRSLSLAHSPTD